LPASNVSNLMLREDVVAAAEEDVFNVYAVETVDEAIELLTGRPSGERDDGGVYPEGTVNRAIDDRLSELAELARKFAKGSSEQ
jgi:predicted ATP-dependent protease